MLKGEDIGNIEPGEFKALKAGDETQGDSTTIERAPSVGLKRIPTDSSQEVIYVKMDASASDFVMLILCVPAMLCVKLRDGRLAGCERNAGGRASHCAAVARRIQPSNSTFVVDGESN